VQGKDSLWWEEAKRIHTLEENKVSWERNQSLLKSPYINEQYCDDREKGFHELRLGRLTMDEFMAKFTNFL